MEVRSMFTRPLPYAKGLTYDPHIVWKELTFYQRHPDTVMFIGSVIGGMIVALAGYFIS
jgi:hypothetical protein